MAPWTKGVSELSSNAEWCGMQYDAHKRMQPIGIATANVPHLAPMPKGAAKLLNASPAPPADTITRTCTPRYPSTARDLGMGQRPWKWPWKWV